LRFSATSRRRSSTRGGLKPIGSGYLTGQETHSADSLGGRRLTPDVDDWNRRIIEEFRANGGKVGGPFDGAPLLLLHHRGAKTGTERVNPVMYQAVGDDFAVFASKAGAPTNPDWYYNLVANARATVDVGSSTVEVTARVAEGEERKRIFEKQKTDYPGFADYERKTTRQIPVVILERTA
jgi:deazaflavin-dependent oxidoreductase (nitroreductase family)